MIRVQYKDYENRKRSAITVGRFAFFVPLRQNSIDMTKKEEKALKEIIKQEIEFGFLHFNEQRKNEDIEVSGCDALWITTITTSTENDWYVDVFPINDNVEGKRVRVSKLRTYKDVKTYMEADIDKAVDDVFAELKKLIKITKKGQDLKMLEALEELEKALGK